MGLLVKHYEIKTLETTILTILVYDWEVEIH